VTTTKVTVIIDSADITNKPFQYGRVRIVPSARIPDPADSALLERAGAQARFTRNGAPTVSLFPNDLIGPQGDTLPGWYYTVYYDECPGNPTPWSFYLLSENSTPQRLSTLAETPVAQPGTINMPRPAGVPSANQVPRAVGDGTQNSTWGDASSSGSSGTVTGISVATAHGFKGTSDGNAATPTLNIETSVTGLLRGDGTSVSAAAAGTDYLAPNGDGSALTGIATSASVTSAVAAEASARATAVSGAITTAETFATGAATSAAGTAQTAAQTFATSAVATETTARSNADALLIPLTQKAAASGVATLDTNTLIPRAQLAPESTSTPKTSKFAQLLYGGIWNWPHKFYGDSYGLVSDGVAFGDAGMVTSAATTLVSNSSLGYFDANCVGKSVMVSTAGGAYVPKDGAITARASANSVTTSFSATANTVGSPGAIGYYGTDDCVAIQAWLTAAWNYMAAHGYAEFIVDPNAKTIMGGAYKINTGAVLLGNAQVGFPVAITTVACGELVMVSGEGTGAPLMHWEQLVPSEVGGAFMSTRTDGTLNGSYGPCSMFGGPFQGYGGEPGTFNNFKLTHKGITYVSPYNVEGIGLDCFSILEVDIDSIGGFAAAVVPTTGPLPSLSSPTHLTKNISATLRMPCAGNQVFCRIGRITSEGHIYEWLGSEWTACEHADCMYGIGAMGLYSGNGVSMVHHCDIKWMQAENCTNAVIQVDGGTKRLIANIGTESISSSNHIYDPTDIIEGGIDWWPQGGGGSSSNWGSGHARKVRMRNMMTIPGTLGPPTVPATTVAYFNYYGKNGKVVLTSAGGAVTVIQITPPGGSAITLPNTLSTSGSTSFDVPMGYSVTLTYASTAPTWVWYTD
jgi:hypothetical protein